MLLIYLTSWKENEFGLEEYSAQRAWKNYDFDIIDKLKEEGYIDCSNKAKSIYICKDGINYAKKLLKKYNI